MRSEDETEFKRQAEVLMAGYPGFISDRDSLVTALWRGLQRMDLLLFARIVDHVLSGEADISAKAKLTPGLLWGLSRSMRSRGPVSQQPQEPSTQYDHFHGFAQRALLVFLRQRGGASAASLGRLLAEKNRIVSDFRLIATEDVVTADEFREAMFRAFDRVFEDASFDEVEAWRMQTCRERSLHFVQRPRPAA